MSTLCVLVTKEVRDTEKSVKECDISIAGTSMS